MATETDKIGVFRIIAIDNLEHDLKHGLYCKKHCIESDDYVNIGSNEIISQRDTAIVKCYPNTIVNDFVPFYFSIRTPMLYNIHTGHGVAAFPQRNIIYLCCRLVELATEQFQWCFTDGNAAKKMTKFFNNLKDIDKIDWHSVGTTDFRDDNADGDEDRVRKKHAEFLVKRHVPTEFIKAIVVYNNQKRDKVLQILDKLNLDIPVRVNPNNKYYF